MVSQDAPATKHRSFSLTPANLAFGLGTLLVLILLAALVLRPSARTSRDQVSSDIAGTCLNYNSDHSRIDRAVKCDQQHDATVLTFSSDQSQCPRGTDAILTSQGDPAGASGVLCVSEKK